MVTIQVKVSLASQCQSREERLRPRVCVPSTPHCCTAHVICVVIRDIPLHPMLFVTAVVVLRRIGCCFLRSWFMWRPRRQSLSAWVGEALFFPRLVCLLIL